MILKEIKTTCLAGKLPPRKHKRLPSSRPVPSNIDTFDKAITAKYIKSIYLLLLIQ